MALLSNAAIASAIAAASQVSFKSVYVPALGFLSRLCGGESRHKIASCFCSFLSRLCGGEWSVFVLCSSV